MDWKSKSEMLKEFWKINIHPKLPHIYQSTPMEPDLFDMPALLEYLKDSPYKEPFMEYYMEAKCSSCGVSAFDYDDDYHGWQIALNAKITPSDFGIEGYSWDTIVEQLDSYGFKGFCKKDLDLFGIVHPDWFDAIKRRI